MMKQLAKVANKGTEENGTAKPPRAPRLDMSTVAPLFAPLEPKSTSGPRHFGLRNAPTFYPTAEQFKEPLKYIETIRTEGEKTGICKIVPPVGWNPDFALDTEAFHFKPRIMRLNTMEGNSRCALNYLDQLQRFHTQQGTSFQKVPMINKKPVNLYLLNKEVNKLGGFVPVNRGKLWAHIGRELGFEAKHIRTLAQEVKSVYGKWVYPYEHFMAKHGPTGSSVGGFEDSPAEVALDIVGPGTRASTRKRTGRPSLPRGTPDSDSESVGPGNAATLPADYAPLPGQELCEICAGGENPDDMLLCDDCNRGYHMRCFDPPMTVVPVTDWFCPHCLRGSGQDYGFEEGEERNLHSFQKVSNSFKENHFRKRGKVPNEQRVVVTEAEVEQEFWRLVESPYEDVEVEYGADLHSSQHGSGFPTASKHPKNPYAKSGWNLNNMPHLPESLFCNIRNDISGMTIPWLYVGMVFSTFCWHVEDHHTYSINYMHWGESKTWYGIPASNADRFEATMKRTIPDLFEGNPDLLFHLTTMLSPSVLLQNQVEVVGLDQRPGEFVVTFPRAYHAGFNQGFNFAEAVNFALPDWLPFGLECVDRYHFYKKQPVFSHDELIIATSRRAVNEEVRKWLKPALEDMRDRELAARDELRKRHPGIREVTENLQIYNEEEDQCAICHQYCFLSCLKCVKCDNGKIVCFKHEDELCDCKKPRLVLQLRFDDEELCTFVKDIGVTVPASEWKIKYKELLAAYRLPPLTELQRLIAASERIPGGIDEATLLRGFVNEACNWILRARQILRVPKRDSGPTRKRARPTARKPVVRGTFKEFEALVKDSERLLFDAPEKQLVKALADGVSQFRAEAKTMLKLDSPPEKQVKDMLKWAGWSFSFDIPEVKLMETRLGEVQWTRRAENAIALFASDSMLLLEVLELIYRGRHLAIKSQNPVMKKLDECRRSGDARKRLVLNTPKGGLAEKRSEWLKQIRPIMQHFSSTGSRFPVRMLYPLISSMADVSVRLDELIILRDDARKLTAWNLRARRILQGSNDKSCAQIFGDLEANILACKKMLEFHSDVFCVCGSETGTMKECHLCEVWYHVGCCGRAAENPVDQICHACDPAADNDAPKRATVEQLHQLVLEAEAVPRWKLDEVDGLQRVVANVQAWQHRIQVVLQDETSDLLLIRVYLRCGRGMHVAVDEEIAALRAKVNFLCGAPKTRARQQTAPAAVSAATPPAKATPPLKTEAPAPTPRANELVSCALCHSHLEEDGELVGCDACAASYHFKCVDLSTEQWETLDLWECPVCLERKDARAESRLPKSKEAEKGRSERTVTPPIVKAVNVEPLTDDRKRKRELEEEDIGIEMVTVPKEENETVIMETMSDISSDDDVHSPEGKPLQENGTDIAYVALDDPMDAQTSTAQTSPERAPSQHLENAPSTIISTPPFAACPVETQPILKKIAAPDPSLAGFPSWWQAFTAK